MHLDEIVEFLNLNEFFNFLTHFQTPISTPSEITKYHIPSPCDIKDTLNYSTSNTVTYHFTELNICGTVSFHTGSNSDVNSCKKRTCKNVIKSKICNI